MNTFTYRLTILFWGVVLAMSTLPQVEAQCVIDSLVPNTAGIYPDTLANAAGCEYYEVDVTFFLPRDTVVDVLGQPFTVPFNYFRIDSITGLPAGLDWSCNLAPNCQYDVAPNNPSPDTLGCIQVFGTPTESGFFPVVVHLTANADVVGNPTDQAAIFESQISVSPCPFIGDCYTFSLNTFCQPAEIQLQNNVPSNGDTRYSYSWSMTGPNGFNFQTTDEDPSSQILNDAGDYILSYSAVVDTFPYTVTGISIDSVDCSDLLDDGDLYWIFTDPNGVELVNTSANPVDNAVLPLATGISGFVLDTGLYELQVWDSDLIGNDDGCATGAGGSGASITFMMPPMSGMGGPVVVTNGGLMITIGIDHPVQLVSCADTFRIDSLPPMPTILNTSGSNVICEGDTIMLMANNADSVQWYFNGLPINGGGTDMIAVADSGSYTVESIDPITGCRISSAALVLQTQVVPVPNVSFDGNLSLVVFNPDPNHTYTWYDIDDGILGTGNPFNPNGSGNFYAIAMDNNTGCESAASDTIQAILASLEHLDQWVQSVRLFPNPAHDKLSLQFQLLQSQTVAVHIIELSGRVVRSQAFGRQQGAFLQTLDLQALARGIYLVQVQLDAGTFHQKIVLR